MMGRSDRWPPHDLDAEAAVLSALLLDREALERVLDILRPEHFYSDANRLVYQTALELAVAGEHVDVVSVASRLRDRDCIARIGGPSYLGDLADKTPAVAHVETHARIVRGKWRMRQVITTCQRIAAEGYGYAGDVQEFIDSAHASIGELAIGEERVTHATLHEALVTGSVELEPKPSGITGLPTGIAGLDGATAGLHPKDVILVGGRTGGGKTSFAGCVAMHVASTPSIAGDARRWNGVLWIGIDNMPPSELANRFASARARIDLMRLKTGRGGTDDWGRLAATKDEIHALPILFECQRTMTPMQARAKMRAARDAFRRRADQAREEIDLAFVVLDYFQKLKGDPLPKRAREENREGELRRASESIHESAALFNVPIMMLVQETMVDGEPEVRDCKAAGMDAQGRLTITWKKPEGRRAGPPAPGAVAQPQSALATVNVLKWRAGRLGPVETHFYPQYTLFTDEAP